MPEVNRDLIRERAAEIRTAVTQVRRYAADDETFFDDERNLLSVQYLLLVAIEAAAAICGHILARTARIAPASYAECLEALRDAGIVDDHLAARLVRMARFRNVLVHRYWQVDPVRVLSYARNDLDDFDQYLAAIDSWLSRP